MVRVKALLSAAAEDVRLAGLPQVINYLDQVQHRICFPSHGPVVYDTVRQSHSTRSCETHLGCSVAGIRLHCRESTICSVGCQE